MICLPPFSLSLHYNSSTAFSTDLLKAQPHVAVGLPVVEIQPQFLRVIDVQVEGLVSVRLTAGLDLAVIGTFVEHVERPGSLCAFVKGDADRDNVLRFVKVVLDRASLVMAVNDVSFARPTRVVRETFVTIVLGNAAIRRAAFTRRPLIVGRRSHFDGRALTRVH